MRCCQDGAGRETNQLRARPALWDGPAWVTSCTVGEARAWGTFSWDGENAQADSEVTCPLLWVSSVLLLSTQQTPVYSSLPPFNVPGGLQYQRLLTLA